MTNTKCFRKYIKKDNLVKSNVGPQQSDTNIYNGDNEMTEKSNKNCLHEGREKNLLNIPEHEA